MTTQVLSAPPKPRVLYLCVALIMVLTGLTIPLRSVRSANGKGNSVETTPLNATRSYKAQQSRDDDHWGLIAGSSTLQLFAGDTRLALLALFSEDVRGSVPHSATGLRTTAPSFHSNSAAPFIPPTISLTSPTNNANFIAGSTITLSATALDSDGTVSKVEFFQSSVKLGEDTTAPYSYDWTNVAAGDYVVTARATDNAGELTTSAAINISVLAQVKQYVGWSSISNGIDLGNGSVRKTSTGDWDFYANSLQTLLPGDGYFESTAANYNQSINLGGSDGAGRAVVIGSGGWVGIYENNLLVAATSSNPPVPLISAHAAGDRYRIEITNSILRYIRYRSSVREVMFTSASALPGYPLSAGLGMSPQNAEWQKTALAQLTRKVTWSSITNGINLGNGSVRKTSTGAWDFSANGVQTLLPGDGYFESTASMYNQSLNLGGSDGASRSIIIGSGGWAGIYENGQEVAATCCRVPSEIIPVHAAGDRYRLEISGDKLKYVKYRAGVRTIMFTSAAALPAYPLASSLGASPQNAEWQNTVIAQLSQTVSWSYITNGIDLGNGSVRKTSTGAWDFGAGPKQQLVYGSGFFESTASYFNHSINLGGSDGASRSLVVGTGGWAAIYENGVEVADTYPIQNIAAHAQGDRYRVEISRGKLRYVRYRSGVRSIMFTSANVVPAYALGYSLGASFQNSEWQNTILSDNVPEYNDASFVSQTVATTMVPGQNYNVSVTMRNTGASTWTPDGDYQLASENLPDNQRWGLNRVNLTTTVLPGSDATFNFTVTAPATGSHSFQWRMVQQGVERFGALTTNVNVQTVNGAPTVSLTSPANNAVFTAGATVALSANASDSDGTVSKVEFFQGAVKLGEDTTAPYTYNWTSVPVGSYVLTARATDNGGATATSSAVNIIVNTPNQPPTISLTSPANNSTFTAVATIQLSANAADSDGVVNKVEFFQGAVKLGEDTTAPYSFNWTNVSAGSYVLTARATDNVGATATSSAVNITVNQPPTVTLTSPTNNATFTAGSSVTLNATASDSDGTISKVEFFQGTVKLGEDAAAPYSFNWTSVPAGSYALTARATDNGGATTTSSIINILVNQPPVANAGGPYSGITGTAIQFNGSGSSDSDGTISSYQWNFGDNNTGNGATPTYTYTTVGTRTVTLTVTDNNGATASATATATITGIINYRLDPLNQTGGEGENPLSRNFNWSVPLVSLPGRAGLDLGLSLSYNSLVWTRNGANISFNDDGGFPSPGFRLGFPVIQSRYFNSLVGKYAFMLITPNGERVELRQVNTSNIYEAADSSYLTLTVNTDNTITVRTTDGTQLSYEWKVSDYECTKIKDRNGNFISINYVSGSSRIDTVVDTLSRTIKFNYDTGGYLSSITQIWNQGTANEQNYEWASFTYNPTLPIQTNFSGVTNVGPQNGSTLKVLNSVKLNNNSSRFDLAYTSWGQVWKISNFAADGHLLNYRTYNLPLDNGNAFSDCPRFTERRDWAESWNGDVEGTPAPVEEVVTLFAQPVNASLPDGSLQTVTKAQVTLPDGTYHQIYFAGTIEGTAGSAPAWQRGLPLVTDTVGRTDANSLIVKQRSAATAWTQDDTNVSFSINPRVTETNVYDFTASGVVQNRKRTGLTYQNVSFADGTSCRLPQDVFEYQANATTVLRRTHTDYNLATTYTDRRIIGLVSEKRLYEVDPNTQAETLMSKVGFAYDEGSIQGTDAPVQHDNTNYTSSFVSGRANVTSVKRYDISPGSTAFVTSGMFYNTAGSLVKTIDPANHQTLFSYVDQFSANGTTLDAARPSTFAYPTMVTDPEGYTASSRYHYDFGAVTWKQAPQPNTIQNLPGPEQTFTYDSIGRIQRVTNLVNGAYTRYVYPSPYPGSQNRIDTYATVVDGASEQNGNEAHSFKVFDGHGRVIAAASSHPGSTGGFSGQLVFYDQMGRVIKQSNPTETSASGAPSQWVAAGDDAQAGWLYTQQTYDWKGRPLVTTNTDLTTKEASYTGCGCAGGEVVTLTDEGTMDAGVFKRRQQKIYSDILGRTIKTEVLNWQGGAPYSTTINTYNARDQVTLVRQFDAAQGTVPADLNDLSCPTGSCQQTTMTYDGFGRLKAKHVPEQDEGTATTWVYNADDTVQSVMDARGASQTFTYNNRHLVTGINYLASAGITATAPVSYAYDAAGNRTSMTDGVGNVAYAYDQLSRMTSETRVFDGLGTYLINYGYNLANEVASVTDPFGAQVGYTRDNVGKVTAVTGSGFGNVSTYASNFQYRAGGQLKHLTYGNTQSLNATYNARLQVASFTAMNFISMTYQRSADGRLSYSHDLIDQRFDRSYSYDHVDQLTQALSGAEARGEPATNNRPYKQDYTLDVWGNMTSRTGKHWSHNLASFSGVYVNNRMGGWQYDADGRNTVSNTVTSTFDAAGRLTQTSGPQRRNNPPLVLTQGFDGDGQRVKKTENSETMYLLRSTVLGGAVITEIYGTANQFFGQKQKGHVYANGSRLAEQNPFLGEALYTAVDPSGVEDGAQLDPLGDDVGDEDPYLPDGGGDPGFSYPERGDMSDLAHGCTIDGEPVMCTFMFEYKKNGGLGRLAADGPLGFALHEGFHSLTSGASSRAGLGSTPLLGSFCVSASSSLGGDGSGSQCSTEITGFTSDNYLGATITPRALTPQNSKPNWDFGSDERQIATLAVDNALNILKTNLKCRDFFKTFVSGDSPEGVLQAIRDRGIGGKGGIVRGNPDASYAPIADTLPATGRNSRIFLYNAFFSDSVGGTTNQFKPDKISAGDARTLTILHELAHAVWRNFHGLPFQMSSDQLDRKIFDKCFHNGQTALPKGIAD